ncbi:PREDICTED: probable allantoicase [Ceratosolen solmsi marchali]|uniref:Allantoate amidinohydrolase n=1 Tax=Ceratosolen solmsi marchali TaxID=326594 RepID=A0AAJ7DYZ2_9HYME|nr:PREDICTED: probable allantoicase [Ceratosolen solmsi marchali]
MEKVPNFIQGLQEVSTEESGGKILFATDDFFGVAENLLKTNEPLWNDEYTEFGKWMDGWETRRKRIAGHDWAIIALGDQSNIRGICVDTAFFTGNYAPRFSLQGVCLSHVEGIQNRRNRMGTAADNKELEKVSELDSENWETLMPMTTLKSGKPETRKHYFELRIGKQTFTHLRFNIFPDGGVARLRIYGKTLKSSLITGLEVMKQLHGKCIEFSNAHYGHPDALLSSWPSKGMYDAWETARRLDRPPKIDVDASGFMQFNGEEWAIFQLEKAAFVNLVEVDTTHFKGNCPDNVKIEGAYVDFDENLKSATWDTILNRTKLMPNKRNGLKDPFIEVINKPINHLKIVIAPDGGLARIRIYGTDWNLCKRKKNFSEKERISSVQDWVETPQNGNFLNFINASPIY